MTITDFTMRCGAGSHCRHSLCADCGSALRANGSISQHPNTKHQYVVGNCKTCFNKNTKLTAEDLQDQRHIIMSDKEMARIWSVDPLHHDWIMRRRFRLQIGEAA